MSCIILFSHCCACYVHNSYNYMLLTTVYRWSLSMCHFLLVLIVYYDGNYHPLLKRSTSARFSGLPTSQETTDLYWKPYWNDESTLNCLHKLPVLPVLLVLLVPCQVQTPFTLTAGEIVVVSFKEEIVVPWPPLPSWCPHKSCEVQSPKNRKNRCAWKILECALKICGSLDIWSSRYHSDPN